MSTSAEEASSSNTSTFVAALVLNGAVAFAQVSAFCVLRPKFPHIYEPRVTKPPVRHRASPLTKNIFTWAVEVFKAPYKPIARHNGLDSFMFIRFLRMIIKMFVPMWLFSWALLFPVDSANSGGGEGGLNMFTYVWIFYLIKSEMTYFINARQSYLIDKEHSSLPQANTVLITGVPQSQLTVEKLTSLFSHLPGGIKKVWINQNLKKLPEMHEDRLKACNKLEGAITKLIKTANEMELKRGKAEKKGKPAPKKTIVDDVEKEDVGAAEKLVPTKQRPTHKLGFLGLFGEKVDSVNWCREEIARLNEEIDDKRKEVLSNPDDYKPQGACFILFNQQLAAHLCAKSLIHHAPYRMVEKYSEVGPEDVIWTNLNVNPYERKLKVVASWAATIAITIFFAIPVAFAGMVSNVDSLSSQYSWLGWLGKLPEPVMGIIQGAFPPVLVAILFALVPIIFRLLSKFEGTPRNTAVELSLMHRYFFFLVFNGFLIATLSSGIISALGELASADVTYYPQILANQLPGASIYFITYITLQGLSGASGGLLQIGGLVVYYIKAWLLGSTPRARWAIFNTMPGVAWGTLFPSLTLLVVITVAYSIIAPVMNGFGAVAFMLFYFTYKYNFLYVYDISPTSDTGGLFFPKAIQHIFTGMYISQICLAALFFLAKSGEKQIAIGEGVVMVILIVITVGFHIMINNSYQPLCEALPLTLASKTWDQQGEAQPLTSDNALEHNSTVDSTNEGIRESSDGSVPLAELGKSMGKVSSDEKKLGNIDETHPIDDNTPPPPFKEEVSFTHPSMSEPQQIVWAAKDEYGISDEIIAKCKKDNIVATNDRAWIHTNEKGKLNKIETKGWPPGEDHKFV
ncbi:DUF221-domain-containing protein [Wallemia mellicola]|nr:DUF221-domain-containing protein [Wallemia mellicola]TIB83147.1 DUF221-domain-containing protein [Wallemia mellicola]TIC37132.1 DUF221-domain-containing protein [Wallemia mellicola]TIC43898.1 DUF221-domain-containing protein [Wallemia mellicola]